MHKVKYMEKKEQKIEKKINVEIKKIGLIGELKILLTTLDKGYSKERQDTFFSYLKKILKSQFQNKNIYHYKILVNKKFAGNIGLFNPKKRVYELGYFILRKYRNKGVSTMAINQILNLGFKELKIKKIKAITNKENIASQKVLKKNGFKIIKRSKDEFVWEKLK